MELLRSTRYISVVPAFFKTQVYSQ
jgi:hypothetical protein